ncbi:MAG: hypothetical protein ABJA78_06680 [Ferruginibacter sp.]
MKKNTIVQFVGFITNLGFDEFAAQWEIFVKRFSNKHSTMSLQESVGKSRFKYISQHEWPQEDFQFAFVQKKGADSFPEHTVKVVQAGGYSPIQVKYSNHSENDGLTKIIAFIGHNEMDIDFYKKQPLSKYSVRASFSQKHLKSRTGNREKWN